MNAVGAAIASAIDDALAPPGAIVAPPVAPARLKALLDQQDAKRREESRPRRTVDKAT